MTRAACTGTRIGAIQGAVGRADEELSCGIKKTIRLEIHFHRNVATPIEIGMHRALEADGKCSAGLSAVNDIKRNRQAPVCQIA